MTSRERVSKHFATIEADVCVVGSGAGGAVVAKELAEGGRHVVVLEQGPRFSRTDFTQLEEEMIPKLYEDAGARATSDQSIVILHGRGVGGTTIVNNNICFRAPEFVLDSWSRGGVERISLKDLGPYYDRVERTIDVSTIADEEVSANDRIFHRGAERIGLQPKRFLHNRRHCIGCGFCMAGCSYDRKQNVAFTYLPQAERSGAQILPNTEVDYIEREDSRVVAMTATQQDLHAPDKKRLLRVEAKIFIIACGSISTPVLLLKNGFGRLNRHIGRYLSLHPILPNIGIMSELVSFHEGIPQCEYVDQLSSADSAGFLLEGIGAHPVLTSMVIPSFGERHHRIMDQWNYFNVHYVMVKDRAQGRVRITGSGGMAIDYTLHERDKLSLRQGMKLSARLYFAAGARQVCLNHVDLPILNSPDDIERIDQLRIEANRMTLFAPHQMGTCRMGPDARTSVTDSYGKIHGMQNLYIADASLFPTSLGYNPQLTIMALATRNAEFILSCGLRNPTASVSVN